jgi:hypothetical protein
VAAQECANQRYPEAAIGTQSRAASRGYLIPPARAVARADQQTGLLAAV